jgi:Ca-activated chloride channel homolog
MKLWLKLLITGLLMAALYVGFYLLVLRPGVDSLGTHVGGRELELLAPRWLGLLCLLPLLWLVKGSSLVDMSRFQQALSVGVRALIVCLIAFGLARPSVTSYERKVCTVFLVDVSASISDDQIKAAREVVSRAWQARGENEVRLVSFAERPQAVAIDPKSGVPELQRPAGKQAVEHSDLQAAIQHAYGLYPPNTLRRMVLISDGNETTGDVVAEAARAAERGIHLHAYQLPERKQKEVLVRALTLPREVRMGAPFDVTAEIYSTHKEAVTLTLYKDEFINGLEGRKTVEVEPGKTTVTFKSMVQEPGFVSYRLVMSPPKQDTWASNNTASATLPVFGRPKVLYVEGEPIYATYLQRALEAEKIDVTVRGPYGVPSSIADLQKFDLVLVSDVPTMYIGMGQMAAIQAYVRDLGGGFIMAGGQNSFGSGGYSGTMMEKILPVRFDTEKKRDQPSLALALCIDRSGSMTGQKLELAKDAAKATAEMLGSSDMIAVIAFDSSAYTVVRIQRAANRLRILSDISRIQAGGGTNIKPALDEAYRQLESVTAKVKHVILLSDGQAPYTGIAEAVEQATQQRITTSAVGVGDGADKTLLQMIAERGNGRFYFTEEATNIPRIFTKETTQVARSALVEEPVRVRPVKMASVLAGIDWGGAPSLKGYVSTKPKPLSEVLLVSHYGEPIFAIWRLGLGKTAAFTSDVKNRWGVNWLSWAGYSQFWAQAVREVMRHRIQRSFEMKAASEHGEVKVTVDAIDRADRFINGLESTLTVLDPRKPGAKQVVGLKQSAAGRYEAAFRLQRYGSFLLRASHKLEGKVVAESVTSISVPYPKEYVDLVQDKARLERVARIGGGKVDPTPAQVFDPGQERVRYHKDLWPRLLWVLMGLFLVDVLLRRVRIFGYAPTPM